MSVTNLFTLADVVTPAGTINQISNQSVDPGIQNLIESSSGQVDPTFAAVASQRPVATFSTSAIARALGYAGWSGLSITTGLVLWFQKYAQGGTRASGSAHTKFTLSHGILVPTSLSWENEGGPAELDYQCWSRSEDGTASPLSVAINQALPSAVSTREYFTCGPASINGTALEVTGGRIDFGFAPVSEGSNGSPWPTFCGIESRAAVITLRVKDLNLSSTLGFTVAQGSTDSLVYLRKFSPGGTRVANGTAEHIKFSVDDGIITVRDANASNGGPGESSLEIACTYDGVNDALAANTASTIA